MNDPAFAQGREITDKWKAGVNRLGPGHSNSLILPPGQWERFDPFLMLAEDWFRRGSFAVHPHRGMETVTYVMEGRLEHYDNKSGSADMLLPGDAQWMTAGRGVVHKEDPAPGETVHSLQLWLNLPASSKMTEPRYQNLRAEDMPVRIEEGARIVVFSGSSGGVKASTRNVVPVTMVEMTVEPGITVAQDLPGSFNGFLFVLEGEGRFGSNRMQGAEREVLWLGPGKTGATGSVLVAAETRLRVLLYAGEPVREPVASRGPFVMNTEEELQQAYRDYRDGKFL